MFVEEYPADRLREEWSPGFKRLWLSLNNPPGTTPYELERGIRHLWREMIVDKDDVKVVTTFPENRQPGVVLFFRTSKARDTWALLTPSRYQLDIMNDLINEWMPVIEAYPKREVVPQ